jgi:hypothetical protein
MAARAPSALASGDQLLLADVVLAECVYVLESFYEVARARVAEFMRAAIAPPMIRVLHEASPLRALEVYEHRLRGGVPRRAGGTYPASARSCPSIALSIG